MTTTTNRCPTTSGPHQCEREAGHAGPCETQAPEYATKPARPVPPKVVP